MTQTPFPALWPAAWRAAAVFGLAGTLNAQTVLRHGHADLGVAYEGGELSVHIHSHKPEPDGTEFGPGEVIVEIGPAAQTTVPAHPAFSFLGPAGSPLYLLSATEHPELPFLGLAADEVEPGVFSGDQVKLTLAGFSGPGEFALFTLDAFGTPTARMNTRDGLDAADFTTVMAGSHGHANWAFSAPGDYALTFTASGTLTESAAVASQPATFNFTVVPEPGTWALLALGLACLFQRRRQP